MPDRELEYTEEKKEVHNDEPLTEEEKHQIEQYEQQDFDRRCWLYARTVKLGALAK